MHQLVALVPIITAVLEGIIADSQDPPAALVIAGDHRKDTGQVYTRIVNAIIVAILPGAGICERQRRGVAGCDLPLLPKESN